MDWKIIFYGRKEGEAVRGDPMTPERQCIRLQEGGVVRVWPVRRIAILGKGLLERSLRKGDKMKAKWAIRGLWVLAIFIGLFVMSTTAWAQTVQKWKLVNPEGIVMVKPVESAPRIASLEGKTVVLRRNGKHNGDNNLNRIAELLTQQVKGIKIIKFWELVPESAASSSTPEKGQEWAKKIAALKPDLVIASQAD